VEHHKTVLSRWPEAMSRDTAAEFLDLSPSSFLRLVEAREMPAPVYFASVPRKPLWLKSELEAALAKAAKKR
jgi:predicted DNA-binding transcriptional regulator AlpA